MRLLRCDVPKWLLSCCVWDNDDLVQSLRHAWSGPPDVAHTRPHEPLCLSFFRGASCLELQQTRRYVIARVPLHAAFRHRSGRRSTYEKLRLSVERFPGGLMTRSGERSFQESTTRGRATQGTTLHPLNRSAGRTTNRHDEKLPTRTHAEVEASLEAVARGGERQSRAKIRKRRAYGQDLRPIGEFNRRLIQQSILHPEHQHTQSHKRPGDAANRVGKSRMSSRRGASHFTTL